MINVTVGEQKTQEEKPFPKLMIGKDSEDYTIIYAIGKYENGGIQGVCISTTCKDNYHGEYYTDWDFDYFTDYNEPITLQNA